MAKVLIVDDEPAVLAAVSAILTECGVETETAQNGKQALAKLAAEDEPARAYGAIILDIVMPIMSGWEVLDALKCNPQWESIPVVVLTGQADTPADITRVTNYDGVFLGKKDFFIELLPNLVQRLLPSEE